MGKPDRAVLLAALSFERCRVPGDVNIALAVGRHAAAAVEVFSRMHQIPLRLEGSPVLAQSSVEHGAGPVWPLRPSLSGAVPGNVHAPALAERDLAAADCADGNSTTRLAIHTNGTGEIFVASRPRDVEEI